jgi:hypothetical protein
MHLKSTVIDCTHFVAAGVRFKFLKQLRTSITGNHYSASRIPRSQVSQRDSKKNKVNKNSTECAILECANRHMLEICVYFVLIQEVKLVCV